MILEAILGVIAGALGAIPFVHTNLILQITSNLFGNASSKAAYSVSTAISHSFFELLPTAVIMKFAGMFEGGDERICEAALKALAISILLLPAMLFLLPYAKIQLKEQSKFLLLALIVGHCLHGRNAKGILLGIGMFLTSGVLGCITLFSNAVREPLFPMLTGFFALPALLLGEEAAEERDENNGIQKIDELVLVALAAVTAAFSTLFPALSVGVLLGFGLLLMNGNARIQTLLPALIVSKTFFDIAASAITGNTRSFAAVLAAPLSDSFPEYSLAAIALLSLFSGCCALAIIVTIKDKFTAIYEAFRNVKLRKMIFGGMIAVILATGGIPALVLTAGAACIGVLTQHLGIRRSFAMGSLIVPSIIYSFGLSSLATGILG